jgi:hypothetical protein
MVTPRRVGDLEISQDLRFQRREWLFERVGWAVMLMLAVATLLGLFGRGWLSAAHVGDGASLRLDYERITRLYSSTELRLSLGTDAARGDTIRVWLDRDFIESVQVQSIVPRPDQVEIGADRLSYVFASETSGQPAIITFQVQPQHPWSHAGRVGLPGGQAYRFSQFVFP